VQEQAAAVMARFMGGAATGERPKMAGHFAGIWGLDPDLLDPNDPELEPSPASDVVMVNQQAVEAIFGAWAQRNGAQLRRGWN
jgi:hypothetical protein